MLLMLAAPLLMAIVKDDDKKKVDQAEPIGNPAAWFLPADYPTDARARNQQGRAAFMLTIGPDGLPLNCVITESSGVQSLDDATCDLALKKARFKPDSRHARREFSTGVVWKLDETPPITTNGIISVNYIVGKDGQISDCKVANDELSAVYILKTSVCLLAFMPEFKAKISKDVANSKEVLFVISRVDPTALDSHPVKFQGYSKSETLSKGVFFLKDYERRYLFKCSSANVTLDNAEGLCTEPYQYPPMMMIGDGAKIFGGRIDVGFMAKDPSDLAK